MGPRRGHRFFMILGSIFGRFLDPNWHQNRPQNGFENTSKIRYKKCIEKVNLCVVSGTLFGHIFDPKIAYFPNVFKALILKMVLTCFYNFFKRVEPQKSLKSCRKTRVFARVTSRSNCKENLWFYTLPGIIFRQFWHQIPSLFWNWFWHRFLTPFWTHLGAKMAPIWIQKSTKNRSKNTSEKTSKNDADLAPQGRVFGTPRGCQILPVRGPPPLTSPPRA